MTTLNELLAQYREGFRGLPTYAELVEIAAQSADDVPRRGQVITDAGIRARIEPVLMGIDGGYAMDSGGDSIVSAIRAMLAAPSPLTESDAITLAVKAGGEFSCPDGVLMAGRELLRFAALIAAPAAPAPTEDQQQAAFEEWLRRVCPSGDVESVQRQWEESSDYLDLFEPAPAPKQLRVFYGPMPESNGKHNYTAILYRDTGNDMLDLANGITIERSEFPDRVRYEADRLRYLLGELADSPDILDYDADKHSGYVAPAPAAQADLDSLLVVLGLAGIQVNGGTHGAPWTVKRQSGEAGADARDALIKAREALRHSPTAKHDQRSLQRHADAYAAVQAVLGDKQ